MKTMCAVLLVLALLALAGGCSTAPENLPSRMRDSHDILRRGSLKTPIGAGGIAVNPTVPMVHRGFSIVDFQAKRDEHGMVFVVGEVKNVGTATQGVELQVVLRDMEDRVVALGSFCPAANHSIVPNDIRPFAYSFGRHDNGVQAELRIIRTFYTIDTLGMAALPR